jgi:hypothetical protein
MIVGGKGKVKSNVRVSGKVRPADSGMKYYDDLRKVAYLRRGCVDNHGKARGMKQNIFNNYVYDLQTDLRKFRFVEVGEADGIFGSKTAQAVEAFQFETKWDVVYINGQGETPKKYTDLDRLEMDKMVGKNTKSAIKKWLNRGYRRAGIFYDFTLMPQPTQKSCWAAAISMLLEAHGVNVDIETVAKRIGYNLNTLLSYDDIKMLAQTWDLEALPPQNLTIDGWRNLLRSHGPIWVSRATTILDQGIDHATIIVGLSHRDEFILANPWPVNKGKIETMDLDSFVAYYEQVGDRIYRDAHGNVRPPPSSVLYKAANSAKNFL